MILNVENFERILKKATLNFNLDSAHLNLTEKGIKSKMISSSNDVIILLDTKNNVIPDLKNEVDFYFNEPSQSILPFLGLIDDEIADIKLYNENIRINVDEQKSDIHFCSELIVSTFSGESPKAGVTYFMSFLVNDEFIKKFDKIKKIAPRFGKVYFTVKDKNLFIETTDKTNRFCNNLSFHLNEVDEDNLTLCFDFKNMSSLMSIIENESSESDTFTINLSYIKKQELGMLFAGKNDESERYYLMSKAEF